MNVVLNLTIKRKWFDLIRTGEKKEEYRSSHNRQVMRLHDKMALLERNPAANIAVFRNGYSMDSGAVAVEITGIDLRGGDQAKHPEWGEPTDKELHFVIKLGKVFQVAPYHAVRDFLPLRTGVAK